MPSHRSINFAVMIAVNEFVQLLKKCSTLPSIHSLFFPTPSLIALRGHPFTDQLKGGKLNLSAACLSQKLAFAQLLDVRCQKMTAVEYRVSQSQRLSQRD